MNNLTQDQISLLEETVKQNRSLAENDPLNLVVKSKSVNEIFEKLKREEFCQVINQILDYQE